MLVVYNCLFFYFYFFQIKILKKNIAFVFSIQMLMVWKSTKSNLENPSAFISGKNGLENRPHEVLWWGEGLCVLKVPQRLCEYTCTQQRWASHLVSGGTLATINRPTATFCAILCLTEGFPKLLQCRYCSLREKKKAAACAGILTWMVFWRNSLCSCFFLLLLWCFSAAGSSCHSL